MSVFVFTGPTIRPEEAARELDATYFPPAAEGDVYWAALKRPQAIGIIDGYFQSIPTVRHKEILWAMSRGIHVFGSASIGALRAAELVAFGMEGVGAIFESYRDGTLEDDDEVAIVHGPAETGFRAGSEAMIDIRHTLRKAELIGVISKDFQTALENIGKQLFFPDRNYETVLRSASERGVPKAELERLRQWLPEGRLSQKREDALAMLRLMRQRLAEGLESKTVSYSFEHTSMWTSACRQSRQVRFDSKADTTEVDLESVLDELRLEGQQYKQHSLLSLARLFAIREADRLRINVTARCRKEAELAFRRERDLVDNAQLERWMKENRLSRSEFDALITDEARLRSYYEHIQFIAATRLPEQLRVSGDYPRLFARASAKRRVLEAFGLKNPSLQDADVTEKALLSWYFEELMHRSLPRAPNSYARNLGFATPAAFRRALLKEFLYRRHEQQTTQTITGSHRIVHGVTSLPNRGSFRSGSNVGSS